MAKCEKREIKPVAPPVEYVLTLTADEAAWLYSKVNCYVNAYADNIITAFQSTGLRGGR